MPAPASTDTPLRTAALWLSLAVALSPAALDLARHWLQEPWARESMIFVPLLVARAIRSPSRSQQPRDGRGWLLVAAGLAVALLGSGSGVAGLARLAIPLAVFGMACATGRPDPRAASIVFFVVPLPFALVGLGSPAGERDLARLAVAAANAMGATWSAGDASIRTASGSLQLAAPDLGMPLVHLLAGLGFFLAGERGTRSSRAALAAVRWALLALPIQLVALVSALGALAAGDAGAARSILDLAPAGAAIGLAYAALRRASRASPGHPTYRAGSCAA